MYSCAVSCSEIKFMLPRFIQNGSRQQKECPKTATFLSGFTIRHNYFSKFSENDVKWSCIFITKSSILLQFSWYFDVFRIRQCRNRTGLQSDSIMVLGVCPCDLWSGHVCYWRFLLTRRRRSSCWQVVGCQTLSAAARGVVLL